MENALELSQRAAVVAEARKWIGTPYHHEADVRGHGVDCGMLIVRCFVDTGVVPPFDPRPYPQFWYLHRSEEKYLGFVLDRCTAREEGEEMQPGDVVVWRIGRCFSHGAIAVAPDRIVHAYSHYGSCVEDSINCGPLTEHKRRVFNPWGAK